MLKLAPHSPNPVEALEMHAQTYNFYRRQPTSSRMAGFAHGVLSLISRPTYEYVGNAEAQIADHLAAGGSLILAIEHSDARDIDGGAAVINEAEALHPLKGNLDVWAKEDLHHLCQDMPVIGGPVNAFIRGVFDNYQALKAFRERDFEPYLENIESPLIRKLESERLGFLIKAAGLDLVLVTIDKINKGRSVAIFPEGTRRKDYANVLPLHAGIARVAYGVEDPSRLLVLPMAIDHRSDEKGKMRTHPHVVMGELISIDRSQPQEGFLEVVHGGMQDCVDLTPSMLAAA